MRLWVNDLMQNQIDDSRKRLDAHAKNQMKGEERRRMDSGHGKATREGGADHHNEYPRPGGNQNRSRGNEQTRGGDERRHDTKGNDRRTPGADYKDQNKRREQERSIQQQSKSGQKSASMMSAASLMGASKVVSRPKNDSKEASNRKPSARDKKQAFKDKAALRLTQKQFNLE